MAKKKIEKAYAISDAKITFVSLVDKPANLQPFIITKSDDKRATFASYGKIVKADEESHFLTGIVYEPNAEDAHDNYMTEEEIEKAAHWFMKNGNKVDLQHSFEELSEACVVESWVAKADCTIEDQAIVKGTWLMTVEVTDPDIWDAVQCGDITGFSMGGVGAYSKEDDDLSEVSKSENTKSIVKRLAEAMGLNVVAKGEFSDKYKEQTKASNFWTAFYTLEDILKVPSWKTWDDKEHFCDDENKIKEALTEFNECLTTLLLSENPIDTIAKAAQEVEEPVAKAGKSMSKQNKDKLKGICDDLGAFLKAFDEEPEEDPEKETPTEETKKEEEKNMTNEEVKKMVEDSVAKQLEPLTKAIGELAAETQEPTQEVEKAAEEPTQEPAAPTTEDVTKMVAETVAKAMEPVTQAIESLRKSRGVATNLNNEGGQEVEKAAGEHYLHGLL